MPVAIDRDSRRTFCVIGKVDIAAAGWRGEQPVVFVDLDDARAYARWAGKTPCPPKRNGNMPPVAMIVRRRLASKRSASYGNGRKVMRSDGRTRFAILKGGSAYRATGSDWYFRRRTAESGVRREDAALSGPGLDRCATVGFRCMMDVLG
jgi:formylglycine-generating enzyme required for sulfatase activity